MSAWRVDVRAQVGGFELDAQLSGDHGVLALIGANGSGKTTLLRAITGALEVEAAEIVIGEARLEDTALGIHAPIERRRVGYVPQGYGLFQHMRVIDNVAFGLSTRLHKRDRLDRARVAQRVLDELGCGHLAGRWTRGLSGGEQQRVALARALALEPRLLLLDEPLAALDATTRRVVRRSLAEHLARFSCPALLVTHDVRDVEALGATVAVIEAGRVVQRGALEALRRAPCSEFVAEFVGA